jgi:hypothetical protein
VKTETTNAGSPAVGTHTPGPWKWLGTKSHPQERVYLRGPNFATILAALDGFEMSEANARLIAIAPDLLELLKRLERVLDELSGASDHYTPRLKEIRAVISKVEGRG